MLEAMLLTARLMEACLSKSYARFSAMILESLARLKERIFSFRLFSRLKEKDTERRRARGLPGKIIFFSTRIFEERKCSLPLEQYFGREVFSPLVGVSLYPGWRPSK